jgi:hypothetical protein
MFEQKDDIDAFIESAFDAEDKFKDLDLSPYEAMKLRQEHFHKLKNQQMEKEKNERAKYEKNFNKVQQTVENAENVANVEMKKEVNIDVLQRDRSKISHIIDQIEKGVIHIENDDKTVDTLIKKLNQIDLDIEKYLKAGYDAYVNVGPEVDNRYEYNIIQREKYD